MIRELQGRNQRERLHELGLFLAKKNCLQIKQTKQQEGGNSSLPVSLVGRFRRRSSKI